MSRLFDGVDDVVTFAPGDAVFPQGPITIAALIKPTNLGSTRCIVEGNTVDTAGYGLLIDSGDYYCQRQFTSPQPAAVNNWQWIALTKPDGSAPPSWHFRNVTTAGAWVHTTAGNNSSNGPSPITHIRVGLAEFFTGRYAGSVAALAIWGAVLSSAAVEAACTAAATDLVNANPDWGTLWSQADVGTAVSDFTGGGGNQTAIVGTAVDPDDPPGFNYQLSTPLALAGVLPQIVGGFTTVGTPKPAALAGRIPLPVSAFAVHADLPVPSGDPAVISTRPDRVLYRRDDPTVVFTRADTLVSRRS